MGEEDGDKPDQLEGGQLSAAISNKVVQLMSEYTGRGPTRARTFIDDGLVVCLLQDTLTKGERALTEHEQSEAVLQLRGTFQRTMRQEASAAIEELTGRRVVAFMSDNHIDPDVAVEVFLLESTAAPVEGAPGR
ncbi:MAG: DUF2294 domain-containing protein [Thermoleophilaceae bacterium]|nr:DUF2294 domain-containing protein [Thermoleophilaceae bacterium]